MRRPLTQASKQGKEKSEEQERETRKQKTTPRTEILFRYSPNPRIATALTPPGELGQSFANWTYERLVTYLREQRQVRMKKTRIFEILQAEGLCWRQQETWFGERVDPDFANKRGPSKR